LSPLPHHPLPSRRFFFLCIRPPPNSPLFPYTTLFRSARRRARPRFPRFRSRRRSRAGRRSRARLWRPPPRRPKTADLRSSTPTRSEEHTSELQSLTNLVCRLLLEKKKQIYSATLSSTT